MKGVNHGWVGGAYGFGMTASVLTRFNSFTADYATLNLCITIMTVILKAVDAQITASKSMIHDRSANISNSSSHQTPPKVVIFATLQ